MDKKFLFEIEGPEYSGKTTLLQNLKDFVEDNEISYHFEFAKLPGTTYLGTILRPALKTYRGFNALSSVGTMLAVQADTYKFLSELEDKTAIVTDRGLLSSIIYQGLIEKCDESDYKNLFRLAISSLDDFLNKNFNYYRIILSINAQTVYERKTGRDLVEGDPKDVYDNMSFEEHSKLCSYYGDIEISKKYLSNSDRTIIIDTNNMKQEDVFDVVLKVIGSKLTEIGTFKTISDFFVSEMKNKLAL
jgi:thymidylate kinase